MFKYRDKKQMVGIWLGACCFAPVFIIAMMVGAITKYSMGYLLLAITQCLWLASIILCNFSTNNENEKLKRRKSELEEILKAKTLEIEELESKLRIDNDSFERVTVERMRNLTDDEEKAYVMGLESLSILAGDVKLFEKSGT